MKKLFILLLYSFLLWQPATILAQSKIKASIPFTYLPDQTEDRYNPRISHKTIPLGKEAFLILSTQENGQYAVEKYNQDLKKVWSAAIQLSESETIEAFTANREAVLVVTRLQIAQGQQQLYGHRIELSTGKKQDAILLLQAPARGRRAGITTSTDGNYLLAYRYQTNASEQIQAISGTLYNGSLSKIQDTKYDLSDEPAILTADVQVSNSGEQYISLISDNMNRLTVRQYSPKSKDAVVMSVLVGGVFDGRKVYIIDSKFSLMPNGTLYGAVFTADEATGAYYSLKAVKFNFEAKDMVFAEEYKFTPEYLSKTNEQDQSAASKPERLSDIYFTDLILTPDSKLVVIAEKKYLEGGENSPYFAKELHLFAYDEYMDLAWNSVLMKNQKAPAGEAFSGISYSAYLDGNTLNLLTLEELNGKYDLHLRRINTANGQATQVKPLGLNVVQNKDLAYVKDFTAWLTEKNLITVVRPGKKAQGLRLLHLQLK